MASIQQLKSICIELQEHYQKRSSRNRYLLGSHQGPKLLSIPLKKGKHQQMPIYEVLICYQSNWQQQHLRFLQTSYGNSPYFEYYREYLADLFEKKFLRLVDFNEEALRLVLRFCQMEILPKYTEAYQVSYPLEYLDLRSKTSNHFNQLVPNVAYEQVFGTSFQRNLCILDAIFHLGPEVSMLLQSSSIASK